MDKSVLTVSRFSIDRRAIGLVVAWLGFALAGSTPGWSDGVEATWTEVEAVVYGARADERGPIGGDEGYTRIVTDGDYTVTNLDELLQALAQVQAGEVVFIPGEVEIDMTSRIYIEKLVLSIPEGVTLASDRGYEGSAGALITSDALDTPMMIEVAGPDVRITGLRIRGPNPKPYIEHHDRAFKPDGLGRDYYYKFPLSYGIRSSHDRLEVDNCEISGFGHTGVALHEGTGHHIHHNYIHHCQYRGLGYGICHRRGVSLIECNLFNYNRHSIAGTGHVGSGYEARNNVELGKSLDHCFDMHGTRDGKASAGSTILIHHNTFGADIFYGEETIAIRGVPREKCEIHHNWFLKYGSSQGAVRVAERPDQTTRVHDNAYGQDPVVVR